MPGGELSRLGIGPKINFYCEFTRDPKSFHASKNSSLCAEIQLLILMVCQFDQIVGATRIALFNAPHGFMKQGGYNMHVVSQIRFDTFGNLS